MFNVTVVDNTNPTITCPGNQNVFADASCNASLPDYTSLASVSDNCDAAPSVTQSPAAGTTINGSGTVQAVTLTVTDASGNSSNCMFNVTVVDNTNPTIPVLLDVNGSCSVVLTAPTTTDNCVGTITGTTLDATTYNTAGTYIVNWSFDDGHGNVISVPQNVIVSGGVSTSTISPVACNSYTAPSGAVYTSSGSFIDTIANASGCDSLITINLTVNNEQVSNFTVTSCLEYTVPSGNQTYTSSGIYVDTIPSSNGCDSIMTIDVTIIAVDTSVTQTGDSLTANANSPATYQWIDCSNGFSVVSGETSQTFTSTYSSDFAVIVTENGCSDTSSCYIVALASLNELSGSNVFIYPNPTSSGNFRVIYDGDLISIEVIDMLGRKIPLTVDLIKGKIEGTTLSKGNYSVQIITSEGVATKRLVVE